MKHALRQFLFLVFSTCTFTYAINQDMIYLLVKVNDMQLKPIPDIEMKLDDSETLRTDIYGTAYVSVPKASLPPAHIHILNKKLEAESWNYSKGKLKITVRKKNYRQLAIKIVDDNHQVVPDIEIIVSSLSPSNYITDSKGIISLVVPNSVSLEGPDVFYIKGYKIIQSNLNNDTILLPALHKSRDTIKKMEVTI
jgi:hypothetical protein